MGKKLLRRIIKQNLEQYQTVQINLWANRAFIGSSITARLQRMKRGTTMSTDTATPSKAAELYTSGKSVVEVASELGVTYGKARKLIAEAGADIRNTSDRLKGKTRKSK